MGIPNNNIAKKYWKGIKYDLWNNKIQNLPVLFFSILFLLVCITLICYSVISPDSWVSTSLSPLENAFHIKLRKTYIITISKLHEY